MLPDEGLPHAASCCSSGDFAAEAAALAVRTAALVVVGVGGGIAFCQLRKDIFQGNQTMVEKTLWRLAVRHSSKDRNLNVGRSRQIHELDAAGLEESIVFIAPETHRERGEEVFVLEALEAGFPKDGKQHARTT